MASWHPQYLIFNDSIIQESVGSPRWNTVRLQDDNAEVRQSRGDVPRWQLDISGLWLGCEQYEELLAFQWEVKGMLNPFLCRNARNDTLEKLDGTPALLGLGNGVRTQFQLKKTRGVQGRQSEEIIRYPNHDYPPLLDMNGQPWDVMEPLRILLNGVQQTNGWTVDRSTGVVTFTTPPANGVAVTATGGFFILVVANQNTIPVKLEGGVYRVSGGVSFNEPVGGK